MDGGVLIRAFRSRVVFLHALADHFRVHAREPKSSILYEVRNAYEESVNTTKTNDASLRESKPVC